MQEDFGRYRLIGVMASGGMARLYLAVMTGVGGFSRVVALKRVLPQFAESPEFVRMFVNEAHLAARLDHPSIVRIFELGEIDGHYFISMEYLPGEDMAHILRRSKRLSRYLPIDVAITIGHSVAEALHCAHELADDNDKVIGLVHRDVSPSNVLVSYHGVAKLADFGIAKATQSTEAATQAGIFKGKYAYAAPEQVLGKEIDRRTDVFALGIVLWEALAMKRLFKRSNDAAIVHAVERAEVPNLPDLRPDVPPALNSVIVKALARRPRDRFQNAQEFSDALDEIAHKHGRATTRDIRDWMEGLFGPETAGLKRRIAQGRGLDELAQTNEGAAHAKLRLKPLSVLQENPRAKPRKKSVTAQSQSGGSGGSRTREWTPWSTTDDAPTRFVETGTGREEPEVSHSGVSAFAELEWRSPSQSSVRDLRQAWGGQPPPGRTRSALVLGASIGAVLVLVGIFFLRPPRVRSIAGIHATENGRGAVSISSIPEGADIFIDGRDTGLKTPAVVDALPTDRKVRIRLEHEHYASGEADVLLTAGETAERKLTLIPIGVVSFADVPEGVTVLIDGAPIDHDEPTEIEPGIHELELLRGEETLTTKSIEVKPGPQRITARPE